MGFQTLKTNRAAINAQLKPFAESLRRFVPQYENVIVKISEALPEIEKGIEDNITEARELLHFLFSSGSEEESYGVKKEIYKFHNQMDSILEDMQRMNQIDNRILSNLKASIEISNKTVNEINTIYDISENLKVYAINSIVNSQKAGDRGRGYQILSSEFIKLSENIASGTKAIFRISDRLQNDMGDFLKAVEELEGFSSDHMNSISGNSEKILDRANTSIKNFSQILDDFLDRIENSKNPTYQIMVELQKQDIIHQQLIHLINNVDDILLILKNNAEKLDFSGHQISDADREEIRSLFTLMMYLIENTEFQIRRVSEEFLDMIGSLEALFTEMNASIVDINSDKNEFAKIVEQENPPAVSGAETSSEIKSVVGYIFDSPRIMIKEIRENLNAVVNRKHLILNLFSQLENSIESQMVQTQTFLPVIVSIKNLLLLSRIEQARYGLDFSIAGVGRDAGFFDETFETLSSIIENIEKAHLEVIENFATTRTSFNEQEEHYRGMDNEFKGSIEVLDQTRNIFMDHFATVMNITNILVDEISEYNDFFNQLRMLNSEINEKIDVCVEIKQNILESLGQLGGQLPLEECKFKDLIYQNIVQKCTVAQERDTIKQNFKEIEIEESGNNSITLF